jgi:hypothetical protein
MCVSSAVCQHHTRVLVLSTYSAHMHGGLRGMHNGGHKPFLHACHWDKASWCTACTREAAASPLTHCVCVPEQVSIQQSDHDAACGRVPGPQFTTAAVSSCMLVTAYYACVGHGQAPCIHCMLHMSHELTHTHEHMHIHVFIQVGIRIYTHVYIRTSLNTYAHA